MTPGAPVLCVLFCLYQPPAAIDSFCQLYERVIREKGSSNIQASTAVKRRILSNDLKYKQFCMGGGNGR